MVQIARHHSLRENNSLLSAESPRCWGPRQHLPGAEFKLLNARLGLLSRQMDAARADVAAASAVLRKYFDPDTRKTQLAAGLLQQVQAQLRSAELPRIDETLAVLATAAAGR